MSSSDSTDTPEDPLFTRVVRETHFRPDDPPEVRRAILEMREKEARHTAQWFMEPARPSD